MTDNTAFPANLAFISDVRQFAISGNSSTAWTNLQTLPATETSFWPINQPLAKSLAFWVMTPLTVQRASLEKNSCPDTWPIMGGILHNIKDLTLYQIPITPTPIAQRVS